MFHSVDGSIIKLALFCSGVFQQHVVIHGGIIPQQGGPVGRNQAADPADSSAVNWVARNIQVIKKLRIGLLLKKKLENDFHWGKLQPWPLCERCR